MRNFTRFAAKIPEHTQGVDRGGQWKCIYEDILHTKCRTLTNPEFRQIHNTHTNRFPGADDSWLEARLFNTMAIDAVPASHPLYTHLQRELTALKPQPPGEPEKQVKPKENSAVL